MTLAALAAVQGQGLAGTTPRISTGEANIGGFSELLSQVGTSAIQTIKSAEAISMQALTGEADVREVASAVIAAEQTLQLSLSVRDKIVSAYLELSRMQI
jgi:flagellar hook-basal body complex protein FliE